MTDHAPPSDPHPLEALYATVVSRQGADPTTSYTARLFTRGRAKIAQKLGEEAVETVVALLEEPAEALATESADLLYHLLVAWAEAGVTPDQVWAELARRRGVSGLAEKAARGGEQGEG